MEKLVTFSNTQSWDLKPGSLGTELNCCPLLMYDDTWCDVVTCGISPLISHVPPHLCLLPCYDVV